MDRAKFIVDLTYDELLVINNALNEILNGPGAIDEREFQTRTGVYRDVAIVLLDKLFKILQ